MATRLEAEPALKPDLSLVEPREARSPRFLEQFLPTEYRKSILEVDFKSWVDRGVNTLLLDAEGTFIPSDLWDVDEEITNKIQEAREAGIENVAIVSNKKPRDEISFLKLTWWAHQIGADVTFVPLKKSERKPSPQMLLKAMTHFGVRPDQTLTIDDKATAGVVAANRAQSYSVLVDALIDENDDRRLIGDVLVRDPVEKELRKHIRRVEETKGLPERPRAVPVGAFFDNVATPEEFIQEAEVSSKRWDASGLVEKLRPEAIIISGYGAEEITLPQNLQELVPLSYGIIMRELQQAVMHPRFKAITQGADNIMKDHGREIADVLTLARVLLTPNTMRLLLQKKHKKAALSDAIADFTDAEGIPARRDKRSPDEPSKILGNKGKDLDPKADKIQSNGVSGALVVEDLEPPVDFALQYLRDKIMNQERDKLHDKGIDTPALWSGKTSTVLADIARLYAMLFGKKHPKSNNAFWHIVTAAKGASAYHELKTYPKLHEWKQSDLAKAEEVMQTLGVSEAA